MRFRKWRGRAPKQTSVQKARDPVDVIRQLAKKLEPTFAAMILDAISKIKDAVSLRAIADALQTGDVDAVIAALGIDTNLAAFDGLKGQIQAAITAGAATQVSAVAAAGAIPRFVVQFDLLNPRTVDFVQAYQFNLIRQITENTREGIRLHIKQQLEAGINPREAAAQIKQTIGLTERQMRSVLNFRDELENIHLRRKLPASWGLGRQRSAWNTFPIDEAGEPIDGITSRRLRDFRFDNTLIKAIRNGEPLTQEQINTMTQRYYERWLRFRATTIARTESLRAAHAGAREQWRQAVDAGHISGALIRKQWQTAGDERVRLSHRPIPGMNTGPEGVGIKFDELFVTPEGEHMLPPIAPNCRCTVIYRAYEPGQLERIAAGVGAGILPPI